MKITAVLLLIVVVTALVVIWAWNSFESRSETYVREELHQMAKTVKEMARDKPQLKVVAHELKRLGHHAKDSDLAHELGRVAGDIRGKLEDVLLDLDKGDKGKLEFMTYRLGDLAQSV